jgi:hypothetical protein
MQFRNILPTLALLPACLCSAADDDLLDTSTPVAETTSAITGVPAFRSLSTTQNGTTIYRPAGVAAGDFLLAALEYDATPVQVVPPTGWTLVADQIAGAGTPKVFHALIFKHVATASEPAEYMFNAPPGVYVDITIAAYTSVTAVDQVSSVGVFTGIITAPNMFTTVANEMLVSFFVDFDFGSWTVATGETQRSNFDANSLQDVLLPVVGPTDKHPASCTTSQQAAVNVLLK